MHFFRAIRRFLEAPGRLYVLAGSFFIAIGWGGYHFYRHPGLVYVGKNFVLWASTFAAFYILAAVYRYGAKRFRKGSFWDETFPLYLAELFFLSSWFFLVFVFTVEWLSLVFFLTIFVIFFWRTQNIFSLHPDGKYWQSYNRAIFLLTGFLFVVQAFLQYAAYHYYILDSNIRYFDIVLFRSIAMSAFWILGYAIANLSQSYLKGPWRHALFILWLSLFAVGLMVWVINLGILYYSGLYFSPVAIEHAGDAGAVIWNSLIYLIISVAAGVFLLFIYLVTNLKKIQKVSGKRISAYYTYATIALGLFLLFFLGSFRNTPEFVMVKSFYKYYFGKQINYTLSPELQNKLLKFGLTYQPEKFYVNTRSEVFSPTSTLFLPDRLLKSKPNILVVELESFSARLSGVYGSKYLGVTPNLEEFANDPNSTIFKNYYNASTPTITGTLSQFCSFLPPTGHNEIQEERKMQNHHLLCLPDVLKNQGGYKYASYVTAVFKEYAHKDGIFNSMGMDNVFGTKELSEYISEPPLSWGYSDHQLFPAVYKFMQTAPQPFFMSLATVDTHPPFDLPKDAVNYGDGSRPVLNMFHTTDDAFGKFWHDFKGSPLYHNTIVIVVADHAIFPGALTKDLFPEEAKTITYYDRNFFVMYVPDTVLPREVSIFSSAIDIAPTILQMLNINIKNSFEGHSIFDNRKDYPNLLGMHELGLYINQLGADGKRVVDYNIPGEIDCKGKSDVSANLTLCDYLNFYEWKRQMLEEGRFWKH